MTCGAVPLRPGHFEAAADVLRSPRGRSIMAHDMQNSDLINLDDATQAPLGTGSGASGGETVIHAAEMFQQQLDQMTAWKTQLSQQMEAMRGDAIKLMERQKFIAQEKARLAEERAGLTQERAQ